VVLEDAAGTLGYDEAERLHQAADLVRQLPDGLAQLTARRDQRPGQHAVEAFNADRPVEPNLGQMRQTIGIVRIGLVGCHVERGLGMARVDADRRQSLRAQYMIEPYRQRPCLEHYPLDGRRVFADQCRQCLRIGCTLAAPDTLAISPNRDGRLFQRNVETDILAHGCSPFDAGPGQQS
jgi:hypothetical protein